MSVRVVYFTCSPHLLCSPRIQTCNCTLVALLGSLPEPELGCRGIFLAALASLQHDAQRCLSLGHPFLSSHRVVDNGSSQRDLHALPTLQHHPRIVGSTGMAIGCSLLIPRESFGLILDEPPPIIVHIANIEHGVDVAIRTGFGEPYCSLMLILWDTIACGQQVAQVKLRLRQPLLCCPLVVEQCLCRLRLPH